MVYLSGPMSKIRNLNRELFTEVTEELRQQGFAVVSSHELHDGEKLDYHAYLRRDLCEGLAKCNSIVLLPGWPRSRGALTELHAALGMGLKTGVWNVETHRVLWMD